MADSNLMVALMTAMNTPIGRALLQTGGMPPVTQMKMPAGPDNPHADAFYNTEYKDITLDPNISKSLLPLVLLHELTHALQDRIIGVAPPDNPVNLELQRRIGLTASERERSNRGMAEDLADFQASGGREHPQTNPLVFMGLRAMSNQMFRRAFGKE